MPGSKAATTLDEQYSTDSEENSLYHRARECLRQLAKVRGKAAPTGVFYLEAFLRFGAEGATSKKGNVTIIVNEHWDKEREDENINNRLRLEQICAAQGVKLRYVKAVYRLCHTAEPGQSQELSFEDCLRSRTSELRGYAQHDCAELGFVIPGLWAVADPPDHLYCGLRGSLSVAKIATLAHRLAQYSWGDYTLVLNGQEIPILESRSQVQSSEDIRRQIHGRPKPSAHMQAARALELVATALRRNKPLPEGITIGDDGSVQFKVERFEGSCKPL